MVLEVKLELVVGAAAAVGAAAVVGAATILVCGLYVVPV